MGPDGASGRLTDSARASASFQPLVCGVVRPSASRKSETRTPSKRSIHNTFDEQACHRVAHEPVSTHAQHHSHDEQACHMAARTQLAMRLPRSRWDTPG